MALLLVIVTLSFLVVSEQKYEYEACIKRKVAQRLSSNPNPTPKAMIIEQSSWVSMECDVWQCTSKAWAKLYQCPRKPIGWLKEHQQKWVELFTLAIKRDEMSWKDLDIRWYRVQIALKETELVPIGRLNFEEDEKHTLTIEYVGEQHGGHYLCVQRDLVESAYYLEVVGSESKRLVALSGKLPRPADRRLLKDKNLEIFTSWAEWSKCSACGKPGLRRRTGICTVKKIILNEPNKPADVRVLDIYTNGLPCRSSSIESLADKLKVLKRRSEVLIDYCYIPCPTAPAVRNITDLYGNLREQVPGEGVHAVYEPQATLPPLVHRETHFLRPGSIINFTCPRSKLRGRHNTRIRWENGSQALFPLTVRRKSRGRVYIDSSDRLIFRFTSQYDSGYYSCWQNSWLVAVFRVVSDNRNAVRDIPGLVYFIAMLLTIVSLFVIGYRMWKSSKDKRYKN